MKDRILADTSAWIEFFRNKTPAGDMLEGLLTENAVWTCGIVMFELLQGVRSESDRSAILNTMSGLPYIEMTKALWQKASMLSVSLKKEGINLPLSDIFIATIAIEHNISVFTLDKHFEQIPNLQCHPAPSH